MYYKLVPRNFRPILRVSATPFRKKRFLDYLKKKSLKGIVLDDGTGLGYSACIASRTAEQVITVEWGHNILELLSYNPYSREFFESKNIKLREGDITEEIELFEENTFMLSFKKEEHLNQVVIFSLKDMHRNGIEP